MKSFGKMNHFLHSHYCSTGLVAASVAAKTPTSKIAMKNTTKLFWELASSYQISKTMKKMFTEVKIFRKIFETSDQSSGKLV